MPKSYGQMCPIAKTLDLLGDRWTLLILRDLMRGKSKYQELQVSLTGIASNVLSDRLKCLESNGIVRKSFYCQHPPRAEYHLTEKGADLGEIIFALAAWGIKHTFDDIVRELQASPEMADGMKDFLSLYLSKQANKMPDELIDSLCDAAGLSSKKGASVVAEILENCADTLQKSGKKAESRKLLSRVRSIRD